MSIEYGYAEGDVCGRGGCEGVIHVERTEPCSCHINPPCFACVEAPAICNVCGWDEREDPTCVRDYDTLVYGGYGLAFTPIVKKRVLDSTKIDYAIHGHSGSSQKCVGVYPEGTTRAEVEHRVRGTFGGRFEQFGNGTFTYIAYTD